jgi:hypothetical protein
MTVFVMSEKNSLEEEETLVLSSQRNTEGDDYD